MITCRYTLPVQGLITSILGYHDLGNGVQPYGLLNGRWVVTCPKDLCKGRFNRRIRSPGYRHGGGRIIRNRKIYSVGGPAWGVRVCGLAGRGLIINKEQKQP